MNTKLEQHGIYNPFEGKTFKVITYNQVDQAIDSEIIEISSQEQFNTVLGKIKQFNLAYAYLADNQRRYKKLITE